MNQKITFPELIELLAHKQRCSKREAENFLRELMTTMTDVVSSGESLRINTLGTFKPVWVEDRVSVNVQTGEPYTIPGHYKLTFTPVKAVREAVNEPFACFVVETLPDDAPCVVMPQNSDEIEVDSVDDDTEDVVEVPEVPATDEDAEPTVVEEEIPQTAPVVVPEIFDETELKRDAVVEEEDNELSEESVDVPQLEVVETAEVEQSEQEVEQPEVEQPEQLPEQLPEQEP
ncbi:MAG: HU family DNA-binding protein, partial [Bacteroidaceae bacterium]|nr:HU family DNA-binding protein [Bacteroidaceae bacterium]